MSKQKDPTAAITKAVEKAANGEEKKPAPSRETPSDKFGAVIQADFPEQMEVLRWLQKDPFYNVVVALHDADTYSEDDIPEDENGQRVRVRDNPDGTRSEFHIGDRKPSHYHLIVKTSSKIRANSLAKRFCGAVHFEMLHDAQEYARYLTHSTFAARDKTQYDAEKAVRPHTSVAGWRLYCDLMQTQESSDICTIIEDWCTLTTSMTKRNAVMQMVSMRRIDGLKSVMAHAYFFDKILGG